MAIFRYFHAIVVGLYGPLIERLDLCQLVDLIFSEKNTLYVNAVFPPANSFRGERRRGQQANIADKPNSSEEQKREELREALKLEADRVTTYDRIQREADWRNNLKTGDYLDALAKYKTPMSNSYHYITGWARAVVLESQENSLVLGFLGRARSNNLQVLR